MTTEQPTLTDAERELIADSLALYDTVESILAARLAAVEAERDEWKARHGRYRVMYRERFNAGLSDADWHAQHCAAVPQLAVLRASITALADANTDSGPITFSGKRSAKAAWPDDLRALLDNPTTEGN